MSDFDLDAVRARLATRDGADYWRSLDELAGNAEFQEWLHREFPEGASEWLNGSNRRQFLKLMGASMALAGLTACTKQPPEKIVPYVKQPEQIVPGRPLFFATAMPLRGRGIGLLVESHMGRPTKIEGNPDHPASLGATDIYAQASVLALYDPDRSRTITYLGEIRPWGSFLEAARSIADAKKGQRGAGFRLLTQTVSSPTLAGQMRDLQQEMPEIGWHQYEPVNGDNVRAGAVLAFGEPVDTHYRFEDAWVVLSLEADFLGQGSASLRHARGFAAARRPADARAEMNRLYVVESTPSTTGAVADHRLPLRASGIEAFARAVAAGLGVAGAGGDARRLPAPARTWIGPLVKDLQQHRGATIVVAGDAQPPVVHALAHAMNLALGNAGNTVVYTEPIEANPVDHQQSIRQLGEDIDAGRVDTLMILGGNPVYDAPADLDFAGRIAKVGLRIYLGLHHNETAAACQWHLPEAHDLESWSDVRASDGTVTIIQPLIAPLYAGRTAHEMVGAFSSRPGRSSYEIVREYWSRRMAAPTSSARAPTRAPTPGQPQSAPATPGGSEFERFWRKALHDGVVTGTAAAAKTVSLKTAAWPIAPAAPPGPGGRGLEIVFRPDPTIYDGRFANNAWLQELPKALTTLTWDNVALVSPATAQRLGLETGDLVELRYRRRSVRAPVWVMPGQAPESVTVFLGYGRTRAGAVGNNLGYNAYVLRTASQPWFDQGLEVVKTGRKYTLAARQHHQMMEGRHLVRSGTAEEYRKNPAFARDMQEEPPRALTMYPEHKYDGYKWGMAIDLNSCVGCNACVIACQAENNIPVVGKDQVARGHEMHWLRLDRYYQGTNLDNPETFFQPVPCMHCENAPCEVVCPVGATVHSPEGINDMVYNRCVGTRYCSNNCPYKVRRFNFLLYTDWNTPSLKMVRNPDVTVRSRGVMEKCTFCIQRVSAAKIEAEKAARAVRDGEVLTACQAVCPTGAIVFGDLNDKQSRVAKLKAEPREYSLLGELNTRPRTSYLAKLRNPNPELPADAGDGAEPERSR